MRFLADENLDFAVVRTLRGAGTTSAHWPRRRAGPSDAEVAQAAREGRIRLTEDKDFGWLAFTLPHLRGNCHSSILFDPADACLLSKGWRLGIGERNREAWRLREEMLD